MREARIILPMFDGLGAPAEDRINHIRARLVSEFGGVTISHGTGWWNKNGRTVQDAIAIFDVAMADTYDNHLILKAIAESAAFELKQDAIYLRKPDGNVVFVDAFKRESVAAA